MTSNLLFSKRRAGILCHITSIPNTSKYGNFGKNAYKFVDFLSSSGFTVWQVLPMGPTHPDLCPYQSLSAHAGNPQLINLHWLFNKGWLRKNILNKNADNAHDHQLQCLHSAYLEFCEKATKDENLQFQEFKNNHNFWLKEYAEYMVLRDYFKEQPWTNWPKAYRDRNDSDLNLFNENNSRAIESIKFQQYIFFNQWNELKKYANSKGLLIIGDIPNFVAHDSAEVWANRKYFALDSTGHPTFVAGVPPDYFSPTGQRWGNPNYRWKKLETDDFTWWINRIYTQAELYDAIRIDHFRGLSKYWEIPANEETAINGRWVTAPGKQLLLKLTQKFPKLFLIAEDLGTITPDVIELRDEFKLPGMNILQFAFDGSAENPYLPKNHKKNSITYTGTHDNDTTVSWYESLSEETQEYIKKCINYETENMPWPIIYSALRSVSYLTIIPMQDLLCLGHGSRMNTPGTVEGNWQWQFEWNQVENGLSKKVKKLLEKYDR